MKKIFILTIFCLCFFSTIVSANTINSIKMDIHIDENGNAQITEIWNCKTDQGTESYHPYYNLGNSKIQNLKVSDEDYTYETLNSWNVNGDFSTKSYKCGFNAISDGVEICWGISEYGNKTYTVEYEITNFVSQLTDSQMVYWTLIPHDFSNEIGAVDITIKSDFEYEDTLDVWGYGNYGGFCYVDDGVIKMSSDGKLKTSEYMTILVKFPQDMFSSFSFIKKDFSYYLNMAEENAKHYKLKNLVDFIIGCIIFISFFVYIYITCRELNKPTIINERISREDKEKIKDAEYYRDIPCDKNVFRAFYLAKVYKLIRRKSDFMGAILLKWLKEKKIYIEKRKVGILKKEEVCVNLKPLEVVSNNFENIAEQELYDMMMKASKDGILEKKELEKWCSRKYRKIFKWFEDIISCEREKLIQLGSVQKVEINKMISHKLNDDLLVEAIKLSGLRKYLKDYSLISERQAIEVKLFEEYLIYAQMLGIAKTVLKEFKKLYPDIIENSNFTSFNDIDFILDCSNKGGSSASSARSAAESYSSGGGGFSSGGGGGGSFGGGGGRRWFSLIKRYK